MYRTHPLSPTYGKITLAAAAPPTSRADGTTSLALQELLNAIRENVIDKGMMQNFGGEIIVDLDGKVLVMMGFVGVTVEQCREWFHNVTTYIKLDCAPSQSPMLPDEVAKIDPRGPEKGWSSGEEGTRVGLSWAHIVSRFFSEDVFATRNATAMLGARVQMLLDAVKKHHPNETTMMKFEFQTGLQHGATFAALRGFNSTSQHPDILRSMGDFLWQRLMYAPNGIEPHVADAYVRDRPAVMEIIDTQFGRDAAANLNLNGYEETHWKRKYWGPAYGRLLQTKKKYDPRGLFVCHHCVGSEHWTSDGNCRESPVRKDVAQSAGTRLRR